MPFKTGIRRLNRWGWIILTVTAMPISAGGAALYRGFDYVEHDPRFCRSCHIMEEPFGHS